MRSAALLAAVVLASVAALVPSGGAQPSPSVTLSVYRIYDGGSRMHRFRFTGSISGREAGEYVTVMQQRCGYSFATAIAGAQTRAGGFWEVETNRAPAPQFDSSTYFARWGAARSRPVTFRGRLFMNAVEIADGRFRIYVGRNYDVLQDLEGRQVVLQRRLRGRWHRLEAARLRTDESGSWAATFRVRARGWTLRAIVPAKNARPCFNQSATERFTS